MSREPFDQVIQVERPTFEPLLARERRSCWVSLRAAVGRVARVADVAARRSWATFAAPASAELDQLEVADDDLQEVVEVVGDAAGELAQRLHLLRLAQRVLGVAAPGDVQLRGEEIHQLADCS